MRKPVLLDQFSTRSPPLVTTWVDATPVAVRMHAPYGVRSCRHGSYSPVVATTGLSRYPRSDKSRLLLLVRAPGAQPPVQPSDLESIHDSAPAYAPITWPARDSDHDL